MEMTAQQYQEQTHKAFLEERRLKEAGFRAKKNEAERLKKTAEEIKKSFPPHISFVEAITIIGFAFINDFFDWLLIGSIPILGDVFDIGTWFIIVTWAWFRRLERPPGFFITGIIELIPFMDILPVYTAMAIGYILYNEFKRKMKQNEIKKAENLEKEAMRIASSEA